MRTQTSSLTSSLVRRLAVAGLATLVAVGSADARPGGGSSFGSRGSRTFNAPAPTATAPSSVQPMQRTESVNPGQSRPGQMGAPAAQPRRFGFGTGMMAGLLGAGVLGMLFGGGFFSGLSGLGSMFGFLAQIVLFAGLAWLAVRFFRRRSEPAFAGQATGSARSALGGAPLGGGMMGGGAAAVPPARPERQDAIGIGPQDYEAFERNLGAVQTAYGREDMTALSRIVTPEMLRYFSSDLEGNRSRGVRNEVSDPKLLQGDLAEAWREGATDYATVAMRFSIVDVMVDRASGRVVGGEPGRPTEATELWTFRRDGGAAWVLSGIQQAA